MRLLATVGLAVSLSACAATPAVPPSTVSGSWQPLPASSVPAFPTGSAEAPQQLVLGEPVEIDGFLYEVVELRRWDRVTSDEGWCLAALIHEEARDPAATEAVAGWELRDETGRDYAFDFGCQDGTPMPGGPQELSADELQPGMAEGHRYWISFDVLDASTHLWLVRAREADGDPVIALPVR